MKKLILMAAVAVAAIGCNRGVVDPRVESTDVDFSVSVRSGSSVDSKVVLEEDGDAYNVLWNDADQLGGWGEGDGGATSARFMPFKAVVKGFTPESAVFTGKINNGVNVNRIRLVHPYNVDTKVESGCNFEADLSVQAASSTDAESLSPNTYMISEWIDFSAGADKSQQTPAMLHLGSVMDVNVICEEAATKGFELKTVTVSCADMPTKVTVDMSKDVVAGDYFTASAFDGITVPADKGTFSTSFNSFPFTLKSGTPIEFTAVFTDGMTNYTAVKSATFSDDITYERALRHTFNVTVVDALVQEALPPIVITAADVNDDNMELDGMSVVYRIGDFRYAVDHCAVKNGNLLLKKADYSCITNVDAIPGLSKIKIEYTDATKSAHVYQSAYAYGTTDEIEGVVDGNIVEYPITGGNEFFYIGKLTIASSTIKSIEITYGGSPME